MRFVDLFAGLGGFHLALSQLGHRCVFASELDAELRALYAANFKGSRQIIHGDICKAKTLVPKHDILCAGFPCQPFSKSGFQDGLNDKTRGTLFHEIVHILKKRRPAYVLLENVGNFERHDDGRTWEIVREALEKLKYNVRGTQHKATGGHGLISPHHFGFPHTRERFYIVASLDHLAADPFPKPAGRTSASLRQVVQDNAELSDDDQIETALTHRQRECIEHWNELLGALPDRIDLPSFPIWGDEIHARYPFVTKTPHECTIDKLLGYARRNGAWRRKPKADVLGLFPSYARGSDHFPLWKIRFIRQNREWFQDIARYFPTGWVRALRSFPSSLRKLEWNCQGEPRDLWKHVLQFRPSGLRVKRYSTCPALVAMTTTQVPILGPKRRFITRTEGLRLQAFPDSHKLPAKRDDAFRALGNAVHVGVAVKVIRAALSNRESNNANGQARR